MLNIYYERVRPFAVSPLGTSTDGVPAEPAAVSLAVPSGVQGLPHPGISSPAPSPPGRGRGRRSHLLRRLEPVRLCRLSACHRFNEGDGTSARTVVASLPVDSLRPHSFRRTGLKTCFYGWAPPEGCLYELLSCAARASLPARPGHGEPPVRSPARRPAGRSPPVCRRACALAPPPARPWRDPA